jgi:hypothetical protein
MTRNNRNFRLAGSVAVLVGCFLPWASVGFFSVNGIDTDDGKLVAVLRSRRWALEPCKQTHSFAAGSGAYLAGLGL